MIICQSFYLFYYVSNRGKNESYKKALLNIACFYWIEYIYFIFFRDICCGVFYFILLINLFLQKQTSSAKWLSVRLWTKWLWVRVQLQSLKDQISACFGHRVRWHSGDYRVWIHSETLRWHDQNIQSNAHYR